MRKFFLIISTVLFISANLCAKDAETKKDLKLNDKKNNLKEKINLNYAIRRMLDYNGEFASEKKGLDKAQGMVDQASAGWFPKSDLTLLLAPIFEEKGNAISSNSNWSKWGVFTNAMLNVVQPIHTFGMISSYKKAAQHGYEVETYRIRTKQEELIYRLKQFYYGYQLANDLLDIVQEAKDKLGSAVKEAEDLLAKNKVKREDVYALKTHYSIIKTQHDEAVRSKYLASKALLWMLSYPSDEKLELEDEYLYPEEVDLKSESDYLVLTTDNRPELKMLYSGIEATKALWDAQRFQKRPMFFLGGFFNYSYSNVREKQQSAFAYDRYNSLSGGAAFGIRMNLDWWTINAVSKQAKAEYDKILTAKDTLTEGMMLQVKKAFGEARDYKNAIEYSKEGEDYASKWFMNAMIGYGMGFNDSEKLIDSLRTYFDMKVKHCMAIYNYNMALAELSKLTGREVVPGIKYNEPILSSSEE
jgi:outer membrane protein